MEMKKAPALALSVGRKEQVGRDGFAAMRACGIGAVELSFGDYDGFDFQGVKTLADQFGVALWSLHLPFMPFEEIDISFLDNEKRRATLQKLCGTMEQAIAIGIDKFVVHASGEPALPSEREKRLQCSEDSLFTLSEYAKKGKAMVAVENLPRTCLGNCSEEINRLAAVNDNVAVCFDTNHLFLESHREFTQNLKKEILTVHISDYDFSGEKHWMPGQGKLDWQEIIRLLAGKGYTGPWLYEVSFTQKAPPEEKELTFADFAENHRKLFAGNL